MPLTAHNFDSTEERVSEFKMPTEIMQPETERKEGGSRSKATWTIFNGLSYMKLEITGSERKWEE